MKFTSFGKKIASFFALLLLVVGLASCLETDNGDNTFEKAQKNVDEVVGFIAFDPTLKESLTSNLPLVEKNRNYPDVEIEWTSSEEDIITIKKVVDATSGEEKLQGVVTRPEFTDPRIVNGHVKVELTVKATQKVDDKVAEAHETFSFNVKAVTLDMFGTIKEIKTAVLEDLKNRKVSLSTNDSKNGLFSMTYGRVLYQWSKSMVISDGTDSMVVYGDHSALCSVGDLVKVQGKVYSYYGQIEFGSEVQVVKLGETDLVINPNTQEEICKQNEIIACKYVDMEIQTYTDALIAGQSDKKVVVDVEAITAFSGATYRLYAKVLKEDLGCGDKYALEDPKTGRKISIYHYSTDSASLSSMIDGFVGKYVYINCITNDRYSSNDVFRVLWNGSELVEAPAPELTDENKMQIAVNAIKDLKLEDGYYNGNEFKFPEVLVEGVTVEWTISPAEVLVDGKLVVTEDGSAKLNAKVTCGQLVENVELTINLFKEQKVVTVAEAKAAAKDTLVTLKGLVSAVYARGFVLYDATGSVLVYANKAVEVKVGDYVKVTGKTGAYPADSTAYQIGSPSYEVLNEDTELKLPEAVEWTAEDVAAAWEEVLANKFNFAGNLVKMTVKVTVSGNYVNATIGDSSVSLSISYPLDSVKGYLKDGATITGYFVPISYSLSSGSPKFFNLILVSVVADDKQQAEALVNGLNVPTNVEADFELPTVEGVTWSMENENPAAVLEGTKVTVTRGEVDVQVVFVATGTVGEFTAEGKYTVTIKGTVEETTEHAGTKDDPYTVKDARMVCDKLEDKAYSEEMFYVKGIVISVTFNSKYSSYTLYIGDTENATEQFQIYSGNLASGVEAPVKGATVVAYGYMQKYGQNLELAGKSGTYPTISSVVNPTVDPKPVDGNVVTWDWVQNSGTIEGKSLTIDCGDFYLVLEQNTSSSPVKNEYPQLRIYKDHILKIVAKDGKKITSVEFTDVNAKATEISLAVDPNNQKLSYTKNGTLFTITATEGLDSISFHANNAQMRFTQIKVTFAE